MTLGDISAQDWVSPYLDSGLSLYSDATCQVAAGGWPPLGDLPAQQPPV